MSMHGWITMVMCCNKTSGDLVLVSACWARSSCGCQSPAVLSNLCARRGRRWRPRVSKGKKFESWSTSSEPPTFPYASPCPGEFLGVSHQWMNNVLHQWMDVCPISECIAFPGHWMYGCPISGWTVFGPQGIAYAICIYTLVQKCVCVWGGCSLLIFVVAVLLLWTIVVTVLQYHCWGHHDQGTGEKAHRQEHHWRGECSCDFLCRFACVFHF